MLAATGPLLRLPQLAIHLDRGVNNGLALDKQVETQPVWGLGDPESADILGELADTAGVDPREIRGFDVVTADSARGAVFGKDDAFFASGRLDDLASVHAGVVALGEIAAHDEPRAIAVLAAFDHEELGSGSAPGPPAPSWRTSWSASTPGSVPTPSMCTARTPPPGACPAMSGTRCTRTTPAGTTRSCNRCWDPVRS